LPGSFLTSTAPAKGDLVESLVARQAGRQGGPPARPEPGQPAQQDPVHSVRLRAWSKPMHNDEFLPDRHVLSGQGSPAGEERPDERPDHPQNAHLRASVLPQRAAILRERPLPGKKRKSFGIKPDGVFGRDSMVRALGTRLRSWEDRPRENKRPAPGGGGPGGGPITTFVPAGGTGTGPYYTRPFGERV
jgi:hypothetical protein